MPPNTAVVAPAQPPVPSPSVTAQNSGSSVSTSTFDADDNDLTHNTVPQMTNVVVQQPKPVDQQVVVAQTVPKVVHVQKIKVRRPRPSTVCIMYIPIFPFVLAHLKGFKFHQTHNWFPDFSNWKMVSKKNELKKKLKFEDNQGTIT